MAPGPGDAATPVLLVGTLGTEPATAGSEHHAGIDMGMMELNWAAYEPEEGEFDEDYERQMEDRYAQLHAAGLPVTLGLGLHYTPGWVTEIPNSHFVDEDGNISDVVNLVFNSAVRAKAAAFIARIDQGLGLDHFQAIRIASGGE